MLELEAALSDDGVLVVPFKGPALATRLYGNVALRPSVDLDFLVRKTDVQRGADVLSRAGFLGVPNREELKMLLRSGNELTTVRSRDGLIAELQWSGTPAYFSIPLDVDA